MELFKLIMKSSQQEPSSSCNKPNQRPSIPSIILPGCTHRQSTTRSVVGNIVPSSSNLKHTPIPDVIIIHIQELRRESPRLAAIRRTHTQTSITRYIIRNIKQRGIRNQQACSKKIDIVIQVVVCKIQAILCILSGEIWWSLDIAREVAIRRIERCFPHLGKLVEDPGDRCLVCFVVHEEDYSLAGENHRCENWPVIKTHGDFRWFVGKVLETSLLEEGDVVGYGVVAAVS